MSSRKRAKPTSTTPTASKKQKHQVTIATFKKWQTQLEREHQTLSWLRCDADTVSKELVDVLWCNACRKHERSITRMKNFSRVWLVGSSNHKVLLSAASLPIKPSHSGGRTAKPLGE